MLNLLRVRENEEKEVKMLFLWKTLITEITKEKERDRRRVQQQPHPMASCDVESRFYVWKRVCVCEREWERVIRNIEEVVFTGCENKRDKRFEIRETVNLRGEYLIKNELSPAFFFSVLTLGTGSLSPSFLIDNVSCNICVKCLRCPSLLKLSLTMTSSSFSWRMFFLSFLSQSHFSQITNPKRTLEMVEESQSVGRCCESPKERRKLWT